MGIDPGLTVTGYGIIEVSGTALRPVAAGVVRTEPDKPTAVRLSELFSDLEGIVAEHHPVEAAIEQVFSNHNRQTAGDVARASGVAMLAVARSGARVFEYTPSAVKMAVTGYGNATKDQVQSLVARRLGLVEAPSPADAADALAVAICHIQSADLRRAVEQVGA